MRIQYSEVAEFLLPVSDLVDALCHLYEIRMQHPQRAQLDFDNTIARLVAACAQSLKKYKDCL